MAHFAKLDENNNVVSVETVLNTDCQDSDGNESESVGVTFLQTTHGTSDVYKKTSYNTFGGKHYTEGQETDNQDLAFRKNYASIGGTYDSSRDAFIPPKPFNSFVLNSTTCLWDSSVTYPNVTTYQDGNGDTVKYEISWDEDNVRWLAYDKEEAQGSFRWDATNLEWASL
tara:strand:+ start:167 stop:676 length:510 start_codon:yes stop_codon:yes gene_type:complete